MAGHRYATDTARIGAVKGMILKTAMFEECLSSAGDTEPPQDATIALPALAVITNEPVADVQAFLTPERLAIAYDLEQEAPTVIALVKSALVTFRASLPA